MYKIIDFSIMLGIIELLAAFTIGESSIMQQKKIAFLLLSYPIFLIDEE